MNKFFLVCPIGLESLLENEFKAKTRKYYPNSTFEVLERATGGLEIECEMIEGLSLNQILKTPSKILMRLKTQKCRDLPKFYNIIKKIPWRDYLTQESVEVSITAKKSRIIHTKRLEDSFTKALSDYFAAQKLKGSILEAHKDDPKQKIFIRLDNDNLTISFDTSGELLHIRGDRAFRGHASIRENIASLLLIKLMKGLPQGEYNLIDPMCGTGTFLFEWQKRNQLQTRKFLYEYLNPLQFSEKALNLETSMPEDHFKYFGFDIDEDIILKLKKSSEISFATQDIQMAKQMVGNNIVVLNPPFGKRVKIDGNKVKFFEDLIRYIKQAYCPVRLGIIIPRDYVGKISGDKTYFKQNGIDVCYIIQKEKR